MGWFTNLFNKGGAVGGTAQRDPQTADAIAKFSIEAARLLGAKSPREAAEITAGRKLSDQEWERFRSGWERNW